MSNMLIMQNFPIFPYMIFLFYCVIRDFRTRSIPLLAFKISCVAGILLRIFLLGTSLWTEHTQWAEFFRAESRYSFPAFLLPILLPFLPALFLYLLSRLSQGSVGTGDIYFLFVSALYLSYRSTFLLLLSGLFLGGLWSMLFVTHSIVHRHSIRLKNVRFPFIPCMLPGFFLALYLGYR